jgi:hypothetical protein
MTTEPTFTSVAVNHYELDEGGRTVHVTYCPVCKVRNEIKLDRSKFIRWRTSEHVQNVWPELDANDRELLVTGTHPACWDAMFGGDDDD